MASKFGKQLLSLDIGDDLDIDGILNQLTEEELEELDNEIDPDNSLLPAHCRMKDQTKKSPTGKFDRVALQRKAKEEKDWEEKVPYEKIIRGKVFDAKQVETHLSKQELEDLGFDAEMEAEFDEVLAGASEEDLVDLAAVLGFTGMMNQTQYHAAIENKEQAEGGFTAVAKTQKYKIVDDEPPNETDVEKAVTQIEDNDKELVEVNLNNIKTISVEKFARLFAALNSNENVRSLHCANTRLTNAIIKPLGDTLAKNKKLEYVNVESNFLTGEAVIHLLENINSNDNSAVINLQFANQRQRVLGVRVEMLLTELVRANPRLQHVGIDLDTAEAKVRIRDHLASNVDQATRLQRTNKS